MDNLIVEVTASNRGNRHRYCQLVEEWRALYCNIKRVPNPIATPPSLAKVILWIAKLGGFLARKGDGAPGPQILWRGFQHLPHITDMFLIMRSNKGNDQGFSGGNLID